MTTQIAIAAPTNQLVRPDPSQIVAAGKTENGWFFGGLIWLIVSTLFTAAIGLMAWRAANRRQDLEALDANARISEAGAIAAQANERAEQERITRLNLEKSLAPRRITVPLPNPRLERFAGTSVRISYSSEDPETLLTAKRIRDALEGAKWKVTLFADDTPHLGRSGVLIGAIGDSVGFAASQLEEFLTANSLEAMPWAPPIGAKLGWYPPRGMVLGAPLIWVVVAAKPDPYFEQQVIDDAMPSNEVEAKVREVHKRALQNLEAERAAKMRRLHDEWFPPGTSRIIR